MVTISKKAVSLVLYIKSSFSVCITQEVYRRSPRPNVVVGERVKTLRPGWTWICYTGEGYERETWQPGCVRERQWLSSQDLCSSELEEGWGCVKGARKGELSRSVSARPQVNVDVSCWSRASACHIWQLKCRLEHRAFLEPLWQRGNVSAGLCCDRSVAHFCRRHGLWEYVLL